MYDGELTGCINLSATKYEAEIAIYIHILSGCHQ